MQARSLVAFSVLAIVLALDTPAPAQDRPIRVIFPFAAGGSGDGLTRLIADKMRAALNRQVIVENRTGAAGRPGEVAVKHAAPDGSTLLITPIAPMAHAMRARGSRHAAPDRAAITVSAIPVTPGKSAV